MPQLTPIEPMELKDNFFTVTGNSWNIKEDKEENLIQSLSPSQEPVKVKDEVVQAVKKPATLSEAADKNIADKQASAPSVSMQDFAVPVSQEQWSVISNAASQSANPDEELNRYAAALTFSREYGVDMDTALQNLEDFNQYQLGKPYSPTSTGIQAIANSFKVGRMNMSFNDLAYKFKQADLNGEDVSGLLSELDAMGNEIAALKDYQPRNIATTALKWTMEGAVPYMIEVGKASLVGATAAGALGTAFTAATGVVLGSLAAATPYTLAAIITMGATVAAVNRTRELEEGASYLHLRQLGIDKDVANVFSRANGLIVGAIEAGLGIEAGTVIKAVGGQTLASKLTSAVTAKMVSSGALGALAKASVSMGVTGAGEFGQEAVQEATDITFTYIAHAIQEMRTDIDPLPDESAIKRVLYAGYRGFVSAAVLGGASAVMDTHFSLKQQADIVGQARAIESKEVFVERMKQSKPEAVTGQDWANTTSQLWEKENKGKTTATSIQSEEAAANELDFGAGEKAKGTVRRLSSGELYTKEGSDISTDTSGAEHHRMLVGDPATGNRYGHIEYEISDNTLTINDVRFRSNYESIRQESVLALTKQFPGYDIQWEAKGENLEAIKNTIIESNPRGKDAGMQYYDGVTNVDERIEIQKTIHDAIPSMNAAETALGATLVQLTAEAKGQTAQAYLQDNFKDGQIFGNIEDTDVVMQGKKGAVAFTSDMKAIIYAGEHADFSTFAHETFHVALRNMGQEKQFVAAVSEASKTNEFTTWLDDHAELFKDSVFDGRDTQGLSDIAAGFGIKEWSRLHEEFAARLYEGYLVDGKTASPKLQGLFQRIAEWMGRIYTTLKHNVALDPRIVEAFDSMLDKDTPLAKAAQEVQAKQETVATQPTAQQESLYQEIDAKSQYDAVVSEYTGTDQWMKAPNGKPTNLTERQWVQVRTPSFLEWFGDWINDPKNASKVVDENGEPLVVYHGSLRRKFDIFRTVSYNEPGVHFGTRLAAEEIIQSDSDEILNETQVNDLLYPVYLKIINSLEVPDLFGEYTSLHDYMFNIREEGDKLISLKNKNTASSNSVDDFPLTNELDEYHSKAIKTVNAKNLRTRQMIIDTQVAAQNYFKSIGLDGLTYKNEGEDTGSISYIVFDSNQIKSAIGNNGNFSESNPNIMFQEDGSPLLTNDLPVIPDPDKLMEEATAKKGSALTSEEADSVFDQHIENWEKWKNDTKKWVVEKGDMLQFGNENNITVIHKNSVANNYPWRATGFVKENNNWTPTGHAEYKTKYEAVIDNTYGRKYRPDILFQEDNKPKLEKGFPKRPDINIFEFEGSREEYYRIIDNWKKELKEWVGGSSDLLQFGDEDLVHVVHKNVIPGENPWRSTSFLNRNGEWTPLGHRDYETKYEAVYKEMDLKDYRPDILFQEAQDKKYFAALDAGDIETAQKIVDAQAVKKGYISNNEFRMNHKAPSNDGFSVNLANLEGNDLIPKDYWTHPHYYLSDGEKTSFYKIKNALEKYKQNGKANLRLYRAIPKNIKEDTFRNGDWVTPDREYAVTEGLGIVEGYKIIWKSVPLEEVWWDVNSIAELGVDDGKEYAYKDTRNNKKLTEVIVKDYEGNIVPPSKRFNYRAYETFFQEDTNNVTEQILEDARGFETWEGLKYYYEGIYGFNEYGEQLDESYQDDAWYQAVFNEANGISETAAKSVEPQMSPAARLADEQHKDEYIREKLMDDKSLRAFMEKIGWVLTTKEFGNNSPSMEDRQYAETVQELRRTIPELVHRTISSNAMRTVTGKSITPSSLKRIRTLMTGDALRYYRDLYADVMEDPTLKPQVIDERLPTIESPGYNVTGFSIVERIKLGDSIEAAPLKKAILSGKETLEGSAEKVIIVMDREIADLKTQIEKAQEELEAMERTLSEREMWSVHYAKEYNEASRMLDAELKSMRKLAAENSQIPAEQRESAKRLQKKVPLLHDQVMKNRASERAIATIQRHEAVADMKEQIKEKQKTKDEAKKVRAYKQKLARKIMVRPSGAINYDQAQLIFNIQATLDPFYRQKSVELEIDGEPQRVTIDEAKEVLEGVSDEELREAVGQRLYERITEQRKPLNDWTIAELEETLETISDLRTEGRTILAAKNEQKKVIARNYQDAIMRSLMATGKYTSQPLVGTKGDQREKNHPKNTVRGFIYSTYAMRVKAMKLDNNTQGTAYRLLVSMKRAAQDAEYRAIERRMAPVFKVMKDFGLTEKDLYQSEFIRLGERTEEYTYSAMMYIWLSQHDQSNRNAVAYGNIVSKDEKIALNHDNESIKALGDARYDQLLEQVHQFLADQDESGRYMALVKAVQADFNAQAPRLNEIAIREFNKAMRVVEQYLPIHRKEFSGADMRQQVAEDLFNAKAGANATGVAKGFQKDRISISPDHQTPVNLDLMGVWNKSARQQEHFIAFAEYGRTLNRVFKNPGRGSRDLENAINRTYGKEMYQDVTEYMNEIINPQVDRKLVGMEKGVKFMRGNLGAAYLTWKMSGLVLQTITSPMPYLANIRADKLIKAYFDMFSDAKGTIEFINEKSAMMKNRTMNVIIDQILQESKTYTDNWFVRANRKQQEIGSMGLTFVDRYAVAGGWLAAYQEKLGELEASGMVTAEADAQAVIYADDLVLKVQPTGDATELAPLFKTGSEFARAFTQFQTSLNVIWSNITYDMPLAFKNSTNKELPKAVRMQQFSQAVGTIVGYALAGALLGAVAEGYGEDDDDIDKLRKWIYWSFTQGTASVPLIGNQVDVIVNAIITGETPIFFGDDFFPGVSKLMKGLGNEATGLTKIIEGETADGTEYIKRGLRNLAEGAGYLGGAPVSGIKQIEKATKKGPGVFLGR